MLGIEHPFVIADLEAGAPPSFAGSADLELEVDVGGGIALYRNSAAAEER
jgi:hypothetical protein